MRNWIKEIKENAIKPSVHTILSHSYLFCFGIFLVGLLLDFFFPLRLLGHPTIPLVGSLVIFLASLLIFWAQKTSRDFKKDSLITKETFSQGPYRYSRTPTNWGLFFLTIGFGLMINALFVVISSLVSLLISKLIILKKEEDLLEKKYGDAFREYKKAVKI